MDFPLRPLRERITGRIAELAREMEKPYSPQRDEMVKRELHRLAGDPA